MGKDAQCLYFRMAVTSTGLTSSQVKVKSVSRVAVSNNRPGYH